MHNAKLKENIKKWSRKNQVSIVAKVLKRRRRKRKKKKVKRKNQNKSRKSNKILLNLKHLINNVKQELLNHDLHNKIKVTDTNDKTTVAIGKIVEIGG